MGSPVVLFTDGASEGSMHTIGGVLVDGTDVEFLCLLGVPEALVTAWKSIYAFFYEVDIALSQQEQRCVFICGYVPLCTTQHVHACHAAGLMTRSYVWVSCIQTWFVVKPYLCKLTN